MDVALQTSTLSHSANCALLSAVSRDALKWAVCVFRGELHAFGVTLRALGD